MKRLASLLTTGAALAFVLASPGSVHAQDLAAICSDLEQAEAGDWAEYETTSPQGSGTMRMALLAEGATPGSGPWFEISGEANGQMSIFQVRIDAWPYTPDDITEVVMKVGGQPAMRLPEEMLAQMRAQMSSPVAEMASECANAEVVATESVETPAGTFESVRLRASDAEAADDGEVWLSTEVPFGIVKSEGQDASMTLVASGRDATSRITETPGEMPAMGAPGGP